MLGSHITVQRYYGLYPAIITRVSKGGKRIWFEYLEYELIECPTKERPNHQVWHIFSHTIPTTYSATLRKNGNWYVIKSSDLIHFNRAERRAFDMADHGYEYSRLT